MKKILSLGTPTVIILSLIGISIYFYIGFINTHNDAQNIKNELVTANAEYEQISDYTAFFSEEDKRYYELKKTLEQAKKQTTETKKDEVQAFLSEYDNAIDYELGSMNSYKTKQNYIKERVAPFFTESAFAQAGYTKIITEPETQEATDFNKKKITFPTLIRNSNLNIVRTYYKAAKPENGVVILKISDEYDKKNYVYQRLKLDKQGDKYIITSFEKLQADITP